MSKSLQLGPILAELNDAFGTVLVPIDNIAAVYVKSSTGTAILLRQPVGQMLVVKETPAQVQEAITRVTNAVIQSLMQY
jgi:hypothetical protein